MAKRHNPVLRFFLHKKSMDEHAQQPVENVEMPKEEVVTPVAPEAPVEEKVEQPPLVAPISDNRDAFNCSACAGEGLKDQSTLCSMCNGTGKVG